MEKIADNWFWIWIYIIFYSDSFVLVKIFRRLKSRLFGKEEIENILNVVMLNFLKY